MLTGIAIFLALLIALLAVPISVAFRLNRVTNTEGVIHVRWLFGLVRVRIPVPGKAKPKPSHKARRTGFPAKPWRKDYVQKRDRGEQDAMALFRQPRFRNHVLKFIRDAWHATHARNLYLRLRIGLGDPADTGRLWAFMGPLAGLASNIKSATVRIEPEFVDPVLELDSHGQFRLLPLQFIALAIAFALSPNMWAAWRILSRGRA